MHSKSLLAALALILTLNTVVQPIGWATAAQSATQPAQPTAISTEAEPFDPYPSSPHDHEAATPVTRLPSATPAPASERWNGVDPIPGASEDWWTAVQAQIRRDIYALSRAEQTDGPAYRGHNPAHQLAFTLTSKGLSLQSAASDRDMQSQAEHRPWGWDLHFTSYGYEGHLQPVPTPETITGEGNRVEYRYRFDKSGDQDALVTEWYLNEERGLEHGFTLPLPPSGRPTVPGPLVLAMTFKTDLIPALSNDTQTLDFTHPDRNTTVLRYSGLVVFDAEGREIPARLDLLSAGNDEANKKIHITIDETGATYPLTIDPIITTPDWTATGENPGDMFGAVVGTAGDVNGDGYDDVIVGARRYDSYRGRAYVYLGSPTGLRATEVWSNTGEGGGDHYGWSVGTAGDVNGDGYDDIIVGAYGYDSERGKTYVYHGSVTGPSPNAVWVATGEKTYDMLGRDVGTAGDVNGDGYSDVIIGAPYDPWSGPDNDPGKVYVYHGSATGLEASAAWAAAGENPEDYFGSAVGSAGDVNSDGYADVIVGAQYNDEGGESAGKAYVYYGGPSGPPSTSANWTAVGEDSDHQLGIAVGTAGDVNGDSCDDVIVGAFGYDQERGKVYVYHGSTTGPLIGSANWTATGEGGWHSFGFAAGTAGDVNDDGYADVIIGAYGRDSKRGKTYVYHGSSTGLTAGWADWTETGEAQEDRFGWDVGSAGDVNGDGYDDVIVGAEAHDSFRGKTYIYHGPLAQQEADWTATGTGALDRLGATAGPAGDVNGDGFSDVVVGAPGANVDGKLDAGRAYVYPGSPQGLRPLPTWSASGESSYDAFGAVGGPAGDVNGDGYDDLVISTPGRANDTGKVYVYYGGPDGLSGNTANWTASGANQGDRFGSVAGLAGDVNGDGYADLVAGAEGYPNEDSYGKVYVYYGSSTGLTAGPADWSVSGETAGDRFGAVAGTAGDVNRDGYDDLAVGAPDRDTQTGKAYVYHGSATGLGSGPADWTATGEVPYDHFAAALGTIGDVNGDGYADLGIGAWGHNGPDTDTGQASVFAGSVSGLSTTAIFTATGTSGGDRFGAAVGTAGDVNGDGYAELIVGAWGEDNAAGGVYVYRGSDTGLDATALFTATGENAGDRFGAAVGTAGDVNGDGISDVIVGAYGYNAFDAAGVGRAYVYHGTTSGLAVTPDWSSTQPLPIRGYGYTVGTAGDVNGDGYADVLIGTDRDRVYVYYGSATGLTPGSADWVAVSDSPGNEFGRTAWAAGDVNGDGYADVVIGAYGHDDYTGKIYVYYGSATGLTPGPADWTSLGENRGDRYGRAVSTAGDVNGDGYADIIVGAEGYDSFRGKAYLYYGSATGMRQTPAWTATGEDDNDFFGNPVARGGDVNGDGYSDIIVGACFNDEGSTNAGKVYAYYGSPTGLNPQSPDWTTTGERAEDMLGAAAGTAGDVNGDGYADVIIGAWGNDERDDRAGKAYLFQGSALGLDTPFATLLGEHANDEFGRAVGTAGDVNGDGYADIVVGARGHDGQTGKVYGYYGGPKGLTSKHFDWATYGENPSDYFSHAVGAAGDVNGDGFADVIVGAYHANANQGKAYLYLGSLGGNRRAIVRQTRGDGSERPVQPWGPTYAADRFHASLQTVNPLGRGRARIQVQACPPGVSFGSSVCLDHISNGWVDMHDGAGTVGDTVSGLDAGTLYRWRARAIYNSPLMIHGPWHRLSAQSMEADLRSIEPACDLVIHKAVTPTAPLTPGAPITYTLAFYAAGGPAPGVVITDIVPADITDLSIKSSGAAITDTGASPGYVWEVEDLAPGEGGVITITGVANATRFVNTASITTTARDQDPTNNRATVQTHIPGVIYVDRDAAGANNGSSWSNAYRDLQSAVQQAGPGDEIWIAEGTYRPTSGLDRTATFSITNGLTLYGGFTGSEAWRHQRDWAAHPVVLSGDIGATKNSDDNTAHVVTARGVTETALLDGLIIAGGNAGGFNPNDRGGGLVADGSDLILQNVAFIGNTAGEGGGIASIHTSVVTLINASFSGNTAQSGGGIANDATSDISLINVTLSHNQASGEGGAIANRGYLTLTNGILWGNTATVSGTQIHDEGALVVRYSDVEGGWPGMGNISANPQFYDADGPDDLAGTLDDDLRLLYTSPAKDAGHSEAVPQDTDDLDGDGDMTESLPLDLSSRSRLIGFTVVTPTVDMGAYEANILDVLADADHLLDLGESFRLAELQLLPTDTVTHAIQNYETFNDGEMFYDFCAGYDQIDDEGYCPEDAGSQNVRNTLLDAIAHYMVAQDWPTAQWTTHDKRELHVWDLGGCGVVSAAHEIANVHLIFGNEFLIDAIDYRFSTAGIPNADVILAQELDELELARQQFELTMDLLFRAFGEDAWGVGPYFSNNDFETFGVASNRMMVTLNEMAARHHMLGDSQAALDLYDYAYEEQYLQSTALAQMAKEVGAGFLRNGSWEMLNTLSQMRDRAQAIRDGLDYFGFAPDYVPLQSYAQLLELTEGVAGSTGLWGTASSLESEAREAQRTFDRNASDMSTELDNLTVTLTDQLFELCGESEDADGDGFGDYEICEGGLMEQNLQALDMASLQVGLAWRRAQNVTRQIQIEQERAGQVIRINLGLGGTLAAAELAIGKLEAYVETRTTVDSSENQLHGGVKGSLEHYEQFEWKLGSASLDSGVEYSGGFRAAVESEVGRQWAETTLNSTEKTWNPNAESIGEWNSIKALREAEASADIEGANSAAVVRNLLLQQSEALLEYEIAVAAFNKLAAEHNYLAQQRSYLLNKRAQAIDRVTSHNSHLLSPAYRIMRDTLTVQASEAHALATQFAYLTARAAEYDLLTPYPDLNTIYRARTANDIRLFLDDLKVWYQALDRPGQLNRYPYILSVARDVLGLTDQNLDPEDTMTAAEIEDKRYQAFQEFLHDHMAEGQLWFRFGTSLNQQRADGQYLFSPNIWNNRIAGIGEPLAYNQGVGINIVTRQTESFGTPEVVLIHGGQSTYRNAAGALLHYDPDTAVPVGYKIPKELDPENTTVVLRAGVNGAGAVANRGLINLSVSASRWTLGITPDSWSGLDYHQIEDIEIVLDTTGRALPDLDVQALQDAVNLQAQSGITLTPPLSDIPPHRGDWVEPLTESADQPAMPHALTAPDAPKLQTNLQPTALASTDAITGSYYGTVIVTSPLTVAVQALNLNLINLGNRLSGTLNVTETALYDGHIGLNGTTDGDVFTVTSEVITNVVLGRTVHRQFTLVGRAEEDGEILKAAYTDVVTNLLSHPITVEGRFRASRPSLPGSRRLQVETDVRSLSIGGSTAVTVTLVDTRLRPVTETTRISLTSSMGTINPATVETVNGIAVASFSAGDMLGRAILSATTGEITATTEVEIQHAAPDLHITKTVTPVHANPGDTLTYTLSFSNAGGGIATAVVITDLLPSALRNPTILSQGTVITPRLDSRFIWDVNDLASGEMGTVTISAQVSPTFTGLLTNTATIASGEGKRAMNTSVTWITTESDDHTVYLPLVMAGSIRQPGGTALPDLVVHEITATRDSVQLIISNAGSATVTDGFWVDVYIDPTSVPTAINQTWSDLGEEGLVWGVTSQITKGNTLALTVGDGSFQDDLSQATWPLAPGTPVYAQVDSWCVDTTYGAVLEDHEHAGTAYENNIGRTTVQRGSVGDNVLSGPPVKPRRPPAHPPGTR